MKLIILQNKLKQGLSVIERASSKSFTLPILRNLLLKAEKNFLELSSTDLEIGIKWWILAKIEKEGKITIPISILSTFINLLPEKPISLAANNQILSVECENYKTKIKGQSSEDFPLIPEISEGISFFLDSFSFCQGLSQIVDIVFPSTVRPEISGIHFLIQKDLIKMAATDSFRLGEKTLFLEKPLPIEKEISLILPQKTAKEIINIFGEKEGELKILVSPNQILFESLMAETSHPQIHLSSKLIEGEYPNYQEIIPKKYETQVVLERQEFLNQIKAASLFSGKINEVKFKIDPKKEIVEISSQNPETGEYHSLLPGKIKGKEEEISFNYRFLNNGLLNIKSSEVIFELNGEVGPGVLKPVGDASYIYVVMPIKGV
ncbi:MAG: DNA polymerase III subunit beta [Candidatus Pacebacteria bacterium]|nr:DNA polymerase III subunit beta [Candidatus Paceibacterota bacterium]